MVDDGLVKASLAQPTVYTPITPAEMFDRILARWQEGAERTEASRARLLEPLKELEDESCRAAPGPSWRVVQGRAEVLEAIRDVIDRATEEVLAVSTHPVSTRFDPPVRRVWDRAVERSRDGVRFQGLFHLDAGSLEVIEPWTSATFRVRHLASDRSVRFVVADRHEILTVLLSDPGEDIDVDEDAALHTTAADAVSTHVLLFERLWPEAAPLEDAGTAPRPGGGEPPDEE